MDALQGTASAKVASRAAAVVDAEKACVQALEIAAATWHASRDDIIREGALQKALWKLAKVNGSAQEQMKQDTDFDELLRSTAAADAVSLDVYLH